MDIQASYTGITVMQFIAYLQLNNNCVCKKEFGEAPIVLTGEELLLLKDDFVKYGKERKNESCF